MTKAEYMTRLEKRLRRLPKESRQKALEYFEEYFQEAGPENEAQAIEDLGTPEFAADQIICDMAVENGKEERKGERKKGNLSKLWVGILAVCSAPVAVPLVFAGVIVAAAVIFTVLLLLLSVWLMGISLGAAGVFTVLGGGFLLNSNLADGIATLGLGLLAAGIGIFIIIGAVWFYRWCSAVLVKGFAKFAERKRGYEK